MTADPWSQEGYRCRLEWGRWGARVAAESGDVLVVIDVLSLSTATVTAVQQCETVYPCAWADDPGAYAAWIGDQAAVNRREVPERGRVSLLPPTFTTIEPGTRVVLASPKCSIRPCRDVIDRTLIGDRGELPGDAGSRCSYVSFVRQSVQLVWHGYLREADVV